MIQEHWEGAERRAENCGAHQQNTISINAAATDIAAIKSSMFQARWIIGLLIGIGALMIGSTLSDIKASIKTIEGDIKIMLPIEARVERLERTVEYNSNTRISELEKYKHDHK